ncbi:hypothetical protein DSO57_1031938 [Entomophthora muscae]|uniref:Uncharacterized protein n=1 Tax=Entomophthora muscae TaxID=34485 RepID=A0ACC2T0Q6_9FUNG|nr:hypothetical protein DSO57_1031938 [Entomophthora muscae]
MLNLQLESFAGGVEGANIVSWLQSTETRLCICQFPEPMWVATASGRVTGPAAVWFTNLASQELDVTWAAVRNAFLNIPDNKLSLPADLEWLASSSSSPAKNNELISNICSILPCFKLEMTSESLLSATKFKPGSSLSLTDVDLNLITVNSSSNQLFPLKPGSSQSTGCNSKLNCPVVTPGDVGSKSKAGNVLCPVLGSLMVSPPVVLIVTLLKSPGSCGDDLLPAKAISE